MNEAMKVLLHAEAVLAKKIKAMKDGKPKYAANERINELRDAIKILKAVDELGGLTIEEAFIFPADNPNKTKFS